MGNSGSGERAAAAVVPRVVLFDLDGTLLDSAPDMLAAINALRGRARRHEVKLDARASGPLGANPMEVLVQASSGQMPSRRLAKAEMRDMVRLAIESLNERQRMAVLLSRFEGMNYAEIGEVMEMSPQAVKSLLCRARENLRAVLEPYIEEGRSPRLGSGDNPTP
mgnify:CR=1 FL=1